MLEILLSPFAPRKCDYSAYFRGAKGDYCGRARPFARWVPTKPERGPRSATKTKRDTRNLRIVPHGNDPSSLEDRKVPKIQLHHDQVAGGGVDLVDGAFPRTVRGLLVRYASIKSVSEG